MPGTKHDKFKMKYRKKGTGEVLRESLPDPIKESLRRKSGFDKDRIETIEDAEEYGRGILAFFNRTLRAHESEREFVEIIEL